MGNQVQQQKRRNPATCLGCMGAENEGFDTNELKIGLDSEQPRGRVTQSSTQYLKDNERNFFQAAAGRNLSLIRFYLGKGININILDEDRTSPLHIACRYGSLQVVEELINNGACLDITDMAGWTPLHLAAHYQRSQVCQLLLSSGADFKIRNREGNLAQDLVRDKMTAEIFKMSGEFVLVNNEQFLKVREAANKQLEEYYQMLKSNKHKIETISEGTFKSKGVSPQLTPQKLSKSNFDKDVLKRQDSNILSKSLISGDELDYNNNNCRDHNNNELSSNNKRFLTPTNSVPRFFDENVSLNQLVLYRKESGESVPIDRFLTLYRPSKMIQEIGIELFNHTCYLGLSLLIASTALKPDPHNIIQWIFEHQIQLNQFQVTKLLTNNLLNEQQQLLKIYVEKTVTQSDLMESLKNYFKRLLVPNDPYILDILVKEFSIKLFSLNNQKRTSQFPFKSEESLHMFCFALVIFDIECQKIGREQAIRNFVTNIQTINNGSNFNQNYVSSIIDQTNQIVTLDDPQIKDSISQILNNFVAPIHLMDTKKLKSLKLYIIKDLYILIQDHIIRIIQQSFCHIIKQKYELQFVGINQKQLLYLVSKDNQTFLYKQKNKLYRMADPNDII